MQRYLLTVPLPTVLLPVMIGLTPVISACSPTPTPAPPAVSATTSGVAAAAEPAALPPPEALADVISRMADPAVPGMDKITLVQNGAAPDVRVLDSFAAALRDVGYSPLTVTARDLRWSDARPGDVLAMVTLTGPKPADDRPPQFSMPMEFTPGSQGWQLTRETAQSLLAFGTPG